MFNAGSKAHRRGALRDLQNNISTIPDSWPSRKGKHEKTRVYKNNRKGTNSKDDCRKMHHGTDSNGDVTTAKMKAKTSGSELSLLNVGRSLPNSCVSKATVRHANRNRVQQQTHFVHEESSSSIACLPDSGETVQMRQPKMSSSEMKSREKSNRSDRLVRKQEKLSKKDQRLAHRHPNQGRFTAPIPSLSRHRLPASTPSKKKREFSHNRPTSTSYAKNMRSMESCKSLPRRFSSPGRRRIIGSHSPQNRKPLAKEQKQEIMKPNRASEAADRIEKSRNPSITETQMETTRSLDFDNLCSRDPPTQSYRSVSNGFFLGDQLDRIECTREEIDENSQSNESRLRERTDDQDPQFKSSKAFPTNSSAEGEKISIRDANQCSSPREYRQTSPDRSHGREIASYSSQFSDQKTARSIHSQDLQSLKVEYSEYITSLVGKTDAAEPSSLDANFNNNEPILVIRSRSLLQNEIQKGNFSIIDIPQESSKTLALYETNILPGEKALDLKAHVFKFDAVFSERDSSDEFYSRTVQRSVRDAVKGGLGAILVFGNDEFGKSNTISCIEKRLAFDLFSDDLSSSTISTRSVSVKYLGLGPWNGLCIDLLSPVHHFVEVIESNGMYRAEGATEVDVSSAAQLLDSLYDVKQRLASERILRRERESSSYSLCQITIKNGTAEPGLLNLVLCPSGDEVCYQYGKDAKYKDSNPLANLMATIRKKALPTQNPTIDDSPRPCNLTRLLGQSIVGRENIRVCLIAAVSPSSDDTDATLMTMLSLKEYMTKRTDSNLESTNAEIGEKQDVPEENDLFLPRQWSKTQLLKWLKRKHFVNAAFGGELSGKTIMNMTKDELKDYFYASDDDRDNRANKLFHALRGENDRIARIRVKRKFALQKAKKL